MASIVPFKAVRAPKQKVNLVPSRSYEEYDEQDLEAQLAYNPFTFLQIINPGYRFHKHVSGEERFQLVKNRYLEFKEEQVLVQDEKACFYLYKMETRNNRFCGLIAGTSAADYKNDLIKKHEDTLEKREQLFTQYLKTVGFNAEPVLLTYPDNDQLEQLFMSIMQQYPEYEFTTTDRVAHFLWVIDKEHHISQIKQLFDALGSVYIADGHHRSSSSNLLTDQMSAENTSHNGTEAYNYFMSYLIPESDLKIYEFNRLVKDLNGLDKDSFLMKLDRWFRIENRGVELYKPSKKHHFGMYLDGEFYSLYLRKSVYEFTDALSSLDTQILYKTVLEPILGITDLRNDRRIEYGYGKHNVIKMKNLIDTGEYAVGFSLIPVTVDEMKGIADNGLTMPPKSTYIEPKLRSGLTIYEF
ncbi:DUF1015 domain-containing protein [Spongiivirga sp. MCCC 1A20706]|uniref:DUF1015 domain-containing protein n=1 Tax=Spongiivirga sp. MCCC 1A20706 TaxID=3160963 RepID=UPI0039774F7C